MAYSSDDLRWGNVPQHFLRHLIGMPGWHKGVLLLAAVLGIIGGTGSFMNKAAAKPGGSGIVVPGTADTRTEAPRGSVANASTPPANSNSASAAAASSGGFLATLSSPTMRIGISVVAGFIFGWIFRAFLKTMGFVALVLFGLFAALSYFGILNVDMTKAKAEYTTAVQWATDQFWRLKDLLVAHLPSSSGGTVGAFLGFKRK